MLLSLHTSYVEVSYDNSPLVLWQLVICMGSGTCHKFEGFGLDRLIGIGIWNLNHLEN